METGALGGGAGGGCSLETFLSGMETHYVDLSDAQREAP